MTNSGGRTLTWSADNQPIQANNWPVSEDYAYDAEGERVKRSNNNTNVDTFYIGGLFEQDAPSNTTRTMYQFNGQVIAQRTVSGASNTLIYLHSDHLGSVSAATSVTGAMLSRQSYDPWGKVRSQTGTSQTKVNYTGQKLDDTGLLYYHARYYDPSLARFTSPDSIVPGASSGVGGAGGTVGMEQNSKLTVDFHESGFLTGVQGENQLTLQRGFWFQLNGEDRRKTREPWGPANPQALNRYAYVLDNPLRYVDPIGHWLLTANYMGSSSIAPRGYTLTLSHDEFKTFIELVKKGAFLASAILAAIAGSPGLPFVVVGILTGFLADVTFDETIVKQLEDLYEAGGTVEFEFDPGLFLLSGEWWTIYALGPGAAANLNVQNGPHYAERRGCLTPNCTAPRHMLGPYDHRSNGGGPRTQAQPV